MKTGSIWKPTAKSALLTAATIVCAALGGCLEEQQVSTNSWPADTIAHPDRTKLVQFEVANFHPMLTAPSGLIVFLPPGCEVVVPEIYQLPAEGYEQAELNPPQEVLTPNGAKLTWFYGRAEPGSEMGSEEFIKLVLSTESFPSGERVVASPWIGVVNEGQAQLEVPAATGEWVPRAYMLMSEDAQLILTAEYPKGDDKARLEAIEVAEAFISTVEPNPYAEKVDIFPGAGLELNRPVPEGTEVAMPDGMIIEATTSAGKMRIEAGPDSKRTYTWEGASRSVIMDARFGRWYGSLGLYYPGPGNHWEEHNGITRGVLEEGQQHFESGEEAVTWLEERAYMPYVYTDDGLVVGWMKTPGRRQLSVEVWQIMIDGKKPTNLPGAQNDAIRIVSPGRD